MYGVGYPRHSVTVMSSEAQLAKSGAHFVRLFEYCGLRRKQHCKHSPLDLLAPSKNKLIILFFVKKTDGDDYYYYYYYFP